MLFCITISSHLHVLMLSINIFKQVLHMKKRCLGLLTDIQGVVRTTSHVKKTEFTHFHLKSFWTSNFFEPKCQLQWSAIHSWYVINVINEVTGTNRFSPLEILAYCHDADRDNTPSRGIVVTHTALPTWPVCNIYNTEMQTAKWLIYDSLTVQ